MSDMQIRDAILDELAFDPTIDAANIGVAVENGVATLTGHVVNFAEKMAAEQIAQRVRGVRAIAMEIEVRYPGGPQTADDQIARRALDVIAWDVTAPPNAVSVKVENGFVTLAGEVQWNFQRTNVEAAVRKLDGVLNVANHIAVNPTVTGADIKTRIESALRRNAQIDAGRIHVRVEGSTVTLDGEVRALHERSIAEAAAWAAPGVAHVTDNLTVP